MKKESLIDEVGYLAKSLNEDLTILERTKIKKSTLKRIAFALMIYFSVMMTFSIAL